MSTKIGTPFYVCPEILNGEYSISCDMWAIGIITYFMLSGYPPFHGKSEGQLFNQIIHHRVVFNDDPWNLISCSAKDFITQLLRKNGKERPTVEEAL